MGYKLHCTKNLLDRIKPLAAVEEPTTTQLGDWYACPWFWKPQLVLLVNEKTLLPVVMPLAPANEITLHFPNYLGQVLFEHGVPREFIEREIALMRQVTVCKTENRSLVGMMNQFTYQAEGYRDYRGFDDLLGLALQLADTPCGPLIKTTVTPERALAAVVAEAMQEKCDGDKANDVKVLAGVKWQEDNAAAIQSFNAYVNKHGLPFKLYRVK